MSFPDVLLGSLLREPLRNGKSARASANGEGVRVFTLTAVTKSDFSEENTKISVLRPKDAEDVWAEPGDIFIERSNTPELVGTAALYTGRRQFAVFPDLLIRVRTDESVDERFLAYFLRSESARRYFRSEARGIAGTMPKISQQTIESLRVPVPARAVQDRIVAALETHFSRLDAAVASLTRAQANVKRARASVLKAAVEGRLVPTEAALARAEGRDYEPAPVLLGRVLAERRAAWAASGARGKYKEPVKPETEGLPGLPEGWCWASLEQLSSSEPRSIQSGPFGSSLLHSEFQPTGKLVIGIDNVQDGYFSMGSEHRISDQKFMAMEKYRARGRDFVITVMATIRRCCVLPESIEPAIITKHVYRVTLNRQAALPEYAAAVVRSHFGREKLLMESQGQTRPGLNGTIIKALPVPLPPLPEQHRIVAEVDRRLSVLDALDVTLDATLARCARLRQSILKRAFEGRLVLAEEAGVSPRNGADTTTPWQAGATVRQDSSGRSTP